MTTHHFITKLIILGMVGFVSSFAKANGPPGMADLSESQRNCLQRKMGSPGSGGRPSREQMETVFKECGITPPSGMPPGDSPRRVDPQPAATSETRIDPTRVIPGLRSLRGERNDYLRLDGRIPRACREKIGISMRCSEQTRVAFTIREITQDGFQCLKDNQNKCADGASASDCMSLEALSRDARLQSNFIARLDSSASDESCRQIKVASAQISIQKQYFDPNRARTEASVCTECAAAQNEQFSRLENQVRELKAVVDRQQEMLARVPSGPPTGGRGQPPPEMANVDPEAMKAHMERVKARMLKKIKSMPCRPPGEDGDDSDPSDMMSMLGGDSMPGGGRGGGPPSGGGGDMKAMMSRDPGFMDDIQDAMDAKMEKCQRQARRMGPGQQMPGGGNMPNMNSSMGGMNMAGMGGMSMGMGGMNMMGMGGASMGMGGMNMMGMGSGMPMMGGMNFGGSGFGNMGMMNFGGMNTMGNMGMMNFGGNGMSSMFGSSPFMMNNSMSSPMMMGYGGMSSMYRSPFTTSYSPYMSSMYSNSYSPFMNYGYGNQGYMNSGMNSYFRSPFMQTSTPYAGFNLNFSVGGTSLYRPYGYGR